MSKAIEKIVSLATYQSLYGNSIPSFYNEPAWREKANDKNWKETQYDKEGFTIIPETHMTQRLASCNDPYWQAKTKVRILVGEQMLEDIEQREAELKEYFAKQPYHQHTQSDPSLPFDIDEDGNFTMTEQSDPYLRTFKNANSEPIPIAESEKLQRIDPEILKLVE